MQGFSENGAVYHMHVININIIYAITMLIGFMQMLYSISINLLMYL